MRGSMKHQVVDELHLRQAGPCYAAQQQHPSSCCTVFAAYHTCARPNILVTAVQCHIANVCPKQLRVYVFLLCTQVGR
jgi:hypothetical protein